MLIETVRSLRVGPFAVFDFAVSYVVVYLLAPYLSMLVSLMGLSVTRTQWLWFTLPIAVLVHIVFRIDTPLTRMVLDPSGHYIAKLIVLGMLYMGIFRK